MTADLLKKILLIDAATCAAIFIAHIVAGASVATLLGLSPAYVAAGGWICLGAALVLGFAGTRKVPSAGLVWSIALVNLGWVAASIAVFEIELAKLTGIGTAIVLAQAAGVSGFAVLEALGAREIGRNRRATAA